MVNEVSAGAVTPTPGLRHKADESDGRMCLCGPSAAT
jgi:hypothetical protein